MTKEINQKDSICPFLAKNTYGESFTHEREAIIA